MDEKTAINNIDEVFSLYEKYGAADYIGESVSQIQHMSQSAVLAKQEGYDDEIVLAAFFHDIGHLYEHVAAVKQMDGYGVANHEALGAAYLMQKGFSLKIAKLVQSHVNTKRYLTFKYPNYYDKLSEASKQTLIHQGGVMNTNEAAVFERDPLLPLYIKIRDWDDCAKVENIPLPDINIFKQMALNHLLNNE